MLDDAAYLGELRVLLDPASPSDLVDTHDGYGRDYWVDDLRVVPSDDGFDDLELTVGLALPGWARLRPRWWFANLPAETTARTLFDRRWREDAHLEEPSSMVADVAREAYVVACAAAERARGESGVDESHRSRAQRTVAPADELWERLVAELGGRRAGDGRIEVGEGPELFTVVVTPEQWRSGVVDAEAVALAGGGIPDEPAMQPGDGFGEALLEVEEEMGSTSGPERWIVWFRGSFCRSTRPELPPVPSRRSGDSAAGTGGRSST